MSISDAKVEAAALVLRRLRECEAPSLREECPLPCSFCHWPWHNGDQSETGCMFAAREMLEAAEHAP